MIAPLTSFVKEQFPTSSVPTLSAVLSGFQDTCNVMMHWMPSITFYVHHFVKMFVYLFPSCRPFYPTLFRFCAGTQNCRVVHNRNWKWSGNVRFLSIRNKTCFSIRIYMVPAILESNILCFLKCCLFDREGHLLRVNQKLKTIKHLFVPHEMAVNSLFSHHTDHWNLSS